MATLQQLIDNFLAGGTSVTVDLPKEVRRRLGQDTDPKTPITDLAEVSKGRPFGAPRRPSARTGSPVIDRMPRSGELREASELRRGPQPRPQGGSMPRPFGRFGQVTDPGQSEFIDFDSPVPISSGRLPGSNENEELDADNIALSLLQDLPANPAARAANQAKADAAKGLKYGSDLAASQNQEGLISQAADTISGLLGNVDYEGLFRVLARPEFVKPMGPGQSPLTNFIEAAAADRTSQAALRAARQEAGLEGFKAETDRLKALMPDPSKMPKLTSEANKLYDSMAASENTARLGKQIQESLSKSKMVAGAPGAAAEGFRAVAAVFGFDPGEMEQDEVRRRIASLKKEILQSRAFGREANKQELEILNKLVQEPDLFASYTQILNSVKSLTESAERRRFNVAARLKAFGLPTEFNATKPEGPGFTRNN